VGGELFGGTSWGKGADAKLELLLERGKKGRTPLTGDSESGSFGDMRMLGQGVVKD